MKCPTCHHPIPKDRLACWDCVMDKAWKLLQAQQYDPLRQVKAGQAELMVRSYKGLRHVQMFYCEMSFCRQELTDKHARSHMAWDFSNLTRICGACRDALLRLMEEAHAKPGTLQQSTGNHP